MIRFQRVGRRNDAAFRIVLTEKQARPRTSGIEALGSFHPKTKKTVLHNDRILYWLSKGATASPTVYNLLVAHNVVQGKKVPVVPVKRAATTEEKKEEAAAAPTA